MKFHVGDKVRTLNLFSRFYSLLGTVVEIENEEEYDPEIDDGWIKVQFSVGCGWFTDSDLFLEPVGKKPGR